MKAFVHQQLGLRKESIRLCCSRFGLCPSRAAAVRSRCHQDAYGQNLVAQVAGEKLWHADSIRCRFCLCVALFRCDHASSAMVRLLFSPGSTWLGPHRLPYEADAWGCKAVSPLALLSYVEARTLPPSLTWIPSVPSHRQGALSWLSRFSWQVHACSRGRCAGVRAVLRPGVRDSGVEV